MNLAHRQTSYLGITTLSSDLRLSRILDSFASIGSFLAIDRLGRQKNIAVVSRKAQEGIRANK